MIFKLSSEHHVSSRFNININTLLRSLDILMLQNYEGSSYTLELNNRRIINIRKDKRRNVERRRILVINCVSVERDRTSATSLKKNNSKRIFVRRNCNFIIFKLKNSLRITYL